MGAPQAEEARAEKWGWTRVQVSGRWACRSRPIRNFVNLAMIRTPGISRTMDYRRIVKGMETVRETLGPGRRFSRWNATGGTTRRT